MVKQLILGLAEIVFDAGGHEQINYPIGEVSIEGYKCVGRRDRQSKKRKKQERLQFMPQ